MDSRDIEAQIKSLIGINLDQVPTGTLPLTQTKGMSLVVMSYCEKIQIHDPT